MRKNDERRQRWIKALNRKNSDGKLWQPNPNSRVCSNHFVDGQPTDSNPDPALNLGYNTSTKAQPPRKLPAKRTLYEKITNPATKKRKSNQATEFADVDLSGGSSTCTITSPDVPEVISKGSSTLTSPDVPSTEENQTENPSYSTPWIIAIAKLETKGTVTVAVSSAKQRMTKYKN